MRLRQITYLAVIYKAMFSSQSICLVIVAINLHCPSIRVLQSIETENKKCRQVE